jgi:hypothetical protein
MVYQVRGIVKFFHPVFFGGPQRTGAAPVDNAPFIEENSPKQDEPGGASGRIYKLAKDGGVATRQYNRTKGPLGPKVRNFLANESLRPSGRGES